MPTGRWYSSKRADGILVIASRKLGVAGTSRLSLSNDEHVASGSPGVLLASEDASIVAGGVSRLAQRRGLVMSSKLLAEPIR